MLDQTRSEILAISEADAAWPMPDRTLLETRRGAVPAFPADVLPPFWQRWCADAAQGAGVPLDYVALALLTAAAGLIGGNRRISPTPAWAEPCVLWTALVGAPSSGKTPGMESSLRLVRALDRDLDDVNEGERRCHVMAHETARAEGWWWRDELRGAVANKRTPPEMPSAALEPQPFMPRRLVAEEPAIAAVAEALRGNPRGILLALDPLAGWLRGMAVGAACDRDRSLWLRAWSAGVWAMGSATRSAVVPERDRRIESAAVSILGTLESGAGVQALAGDAGVAARLLFTWPGGAPVRPLSAATLALGPESLRALTRLRDLFGVPQAVPLSAGALSAFEDFRQVHATGAEGLEDTEAAWWGKGAGTVLRLAGVWTFLDWAVRPDDVPEPPAVPLAALQAGAALWHGYLWPHAHAVLATVDSSEARQQARKALLWIRRQAQIEVSRDDLWRHARVARKAAGVDQVIQALVAANWLRPIDLGPPVRGRPKIRWAVNPALTRPVGRDG